MSIKDIVLRLRAVFFRRQVEQDLQDELQFHLDMQARKHGDTAQARRQGRVKFGSVDSAAEECRDARGVSAIEFLGRDIRFAVRMLRKSRGFTGVAVITLALSIGANAVVFGVLNALILRPLNVPDAGSLYEVDRNGWGFQSYPNYIDEQDRNRSFDDLAAFTIGAGAIDPGGGNPLPVWCYEVTGN